MQWTQVDGHRIKVLTIGSATIHIRRPILTGDDYQRRIRLAQNALEAFGRTIR